MTGPARGPRDRMRQAGITYLAVLLLVALMGAALAATGVLWHTAQTREKERELLFVGNEYRRAIQLYYLNTPGSVKQFPRELSDLIRDPRQPAVRRYLRKPYRDPMTGKPEWGLVKSPDGGIAGVYSLSGEAPFKTANFGKDDAGFEGTTKYSDWKFVFDAAAAGGQRPPAGPVPEQKPPAQSASPSQPKP